MKTLPPDVQPYQRTKEFTETTVPSGLTNRHNTKAGVWARIHVLEGGLVYRILEPTERAHRLTPGFDGIVEPQVEHRVEIDESVRFYVEFLR